MLVIWRDKQLSQYSQMCSQCWIAPKLRHERDHCGVNIITVLTNVARGTFLPPHHHLQQEQVKFL